ncbi:MAG: HEAT repeat domain-containing protein [Planctomycetota bacterium]
MKRRGRGSLALCALATLAVVSRAATFDTPPDPGFETAALAADAIVEVEIIAGGPFRAVAQTRKALKGATPKVFELVGYNSYNWDTVQHGFTVGQRYILFLSGTGHPTTFAPLTPATPRLSVQPEGVMLPLGNPPFRIPVNKRALEEGIALLLEAAATGKTPNRAESFLRTLWDAGEIESRYLAVALAGSLRERHAVAMLSEASRDKLLKLRLTAVEALGKIGSPAAVAVLRGLLKDEKTSVAREAARVLVNTGDSATLPELLEWARRLAVKIPLAAATDAPAPEQAKSESVALDVLALAGAAGALLDRTTLCQTLLKIAHSKNEMLACAALQVLGEMAQAAEIPALLELADDKTYAWNAQAMTILQRLTLKWFKNTSEFRIWWSQSGSRFGENLKRDLVESYTRGVVSSDNADERYAILDLLRSAPGEITVVSVAPFLLRPSTADYFSADDLAAWNSPMATPFLIERLGCDAASERRDALRGLTQLSAKHPRLKVALWPLLRAMLADPDVACHCMAQNAAGVLLQSDAMSALLDATQYATGYESGAAGRAIYQLTARTFGFSISESFSDQNEARRWLRSWWRSAEQTFKPLPRPAMSNYVFGNELEAAERVAKLEAFALADDSRASGAAFALLYAERSASDPFWQKLLMQTRQRDKAHGLLGLVGGDAALADSLAQRLVGAGDHADSPLCRMISLFALSSLKGAVGTEKILNWLKKHGDKAESAMRRLAILTLGLADREPKSLTYLTELLEQGLAVKNRESEDKSTGQYATLQPVLIALCARSDSDQLLLRALDKAYDIRTREMAGRTLSVRRHHPALAGLLKLLKKKDRYGWSDLCRLIEPLLQPKDASSARALLNSSNNSQRSAGAYLLALRPEVGVDEDTLAQLMIGLTDPSNVVRYYCAQALGKRRAIKALRRLTALLADEDEEVRASAAEALGQIGDSQSCDMVAVIAEQESRLDTRWLRALAIAGIDKHFDMLMKLCNSTLYAEQRAGLNALIASDKPQAQLRVLKTFRDDDSAMQTVAADALAQRGEATTTALRDDLKNSNKAARARAIYLLSRVNTANSRAVLRQALEDKDETLRALAEFCLTRLNNEQW